VLLGGDLVITGYIDRYMVGYDKGTHRVKIVGRSKTEDIVDCAVDVTTSGIDSWQINATTLKQAAEILCKPYGITVAAPDGDGPFPAQAPSTYFSIYPGSRSLR
jgi:prophage tail gpP-like protein